MKKHLTEKDKNKARKIIDKQRDLYADSVAFGIKSIFYKSAVMFNLSHNKLYEYAGFDTWEDFVIAVFSITRQQSYKYIGIGAAIAKRLPQYSPLPDAEVLILKTDIDAIITPELSKANVSVKDLKQLAAHGEAFDAFITNASGCDSDNKVEKLFDNNSETMIQEIEQDEPPTVAEIKSAPRKYATGIDGTIKRVVKDLSALQVAFQALHLTPAFRAGKNKKWREVWFLLQVLIALIDEPENGKVEKYNYEDAVALKEKYDKDKRGLPPVLKRALNFTV
jgi:hypothetical protein